MPFEICACGETYNTDIGCKCKGKKIIPIKIVKEPKKETMKIKTPTQPKKKKMKITKPLSREQEKLKNFCKTMGIKKLIVREKR